MMPSGTIASTRFYAERQLVEKVVDALGRTPQIARRFALRALRWENDVPPVLGEAPQKLVDAYLGAAQDAVVAIGNSVTTPSVVIRPTLPCGFVRGPWCQWCPPRNQRAPSGQGAMSVGKAWAVGNENSVTVPSVVMRPTFCP
jgi:hypothetical protein